MAVMLGQWLRLALLIWWLGDATPTAWRNCSSTDAVVALVIARLRSRCRWRFSCWRRDDAVERRRIISVSVLFVPATSASRIAVCAAMLIAIAVVGWLLGCDLVTPFQIKSYSSAPSGPWLLALFLAWSWSRPIGEEITFRGFLFRGWVRPDGNA